MVLGGIVDYGKALMLVQDVYHTLLEMFYMLHKKVVGL